MKWKLKQGLEYIDKLLCAVFGLKEEADISQQSPIIIKKQNNISVIINEPYKRVCHEYRVSDFMQTQLPNLDERFQQKFGSALGQVIAGDLIISFSGNDLNDDKQ